MEAKQTTIAEAHKLLLHLRFASYRLWLHFRIKNHARGKKFTFNFFVYVSHFSP